MVYSAFPSCTATSDCGALIEFDRQEYVMDTPNLLAVPAILLRQHAGRLSTSDQMIAESCIEFMLRGY